MGRDRFVQAAFQTGSDFNPRALVGRDQTTRRRSRSSAYFNPRALVGRDLQSTAPDKASGNFNPRALVGRDLPSACRGSWIDSISIHAPSWGATPHSMDALIGKSFQSTRPRGARRGLSLKSRRKSYFNPRALVGRDIKYNNYVQDLKHFNPRALVGRDNKLPPSSTSSGHFNPRALVGRDINFTKSQTFCIISIHAPSWGATVPVYTGLITAVTLYFSRTSFSAVLLQAFFVAKSSV